MISYPLVKVGFNTSNIPQRLFVIINTQRMYDDLSYDIIAFVDLEYSTLEINGFLLIKPGSSRLLTMFSFKGNAGQEEEFLYPLTFHLGLRAVRDYESPFFLTFADVERSFL